MNSNFNESELVKLQGKSYPVVGGRLRLAHEDNQSLNIESNIIQYDGQVAVIQATVRTDKGTYNGIGNASITRDSRLKSAILELAETRAIARALRFSGYGVEYMSYEESEDVIEESELLNQKITESKAVIIEKLIEKRGGDINKTLKHYNIEKLSDLTCGQAGELLTKLGGESE